MAEVPVQDKRKFFMLPQGFEGGGYYAYGIPDRGRSQYAHPRMLTVVQQIATSWAHIDARKFGVGDISLADGVDHPDHVTHESGLEVDVRPLRKDGKHQPCTIHDAHYDRDATSTLIQLFQRHPMVRYVTFNDLKIPHVRFGSGHNNHFHVVLRQGSP